MPDEAWRRLVAGVIAYPDSWPQVRDLHPKPPGDDPYLTAAWQIIDGLHTNGDTITVLRFSRQLCTLRELSLSPLLPGDQEALRRLPSDRDVFDGVASVITEATDLARLRVNRAAKTMLGRYQDRLESDPLADAQTLLAELQDALRKKYPRRLSVPLANVAEETRRALESTSPATIPTGFEAIDSEIGGLPIGQLTLVGARTGRGKTTFLGALARNQVFPHAAVPAAKTKTRREPADGGPYILFVSCENPTGMICERLACDMLDITSDDMRDARSGAVEVADARISGPCREPYIEALAGRGRFTIIDEVSMGNTSITSVSRTIDTWADGVLADNPDAPMLVLVDYLQRLEPTEQQAKDQRHRQIELHAKTLATLAKTRSIALVASVQLQDSPDDSEPVRGDCRESKGANNESGLILLMHTRSSKQRAALESEHGEDSPIARCLSILCDKARGARDGWRAVLDFDRTHYRITDATDPKNYMLDSSTLRVANGAKRPRRSSSN